MLFAVAGAARARTLDAPRYGLTVDEYVALIDEARVHLDGDLRTKRFMPSYSSDTVVIARRNGRSWSATFDQFAGVNHCNRDA